MGFLDHSTNNIILDAVLTDQGRQFLARNDGSFSIVKFALGDDEVDYSTISKFGRTVGKEKLEKNTPIFEALTNQSHALKFKCISNSNPDLLRLPSLTLKDVTNNVVALGVLGTTNPKTEKVQITQTVVGEDTIPVELRDQAFLVELNNSFLEIDNNIPDNIDGQNQSTYLLTKDPTPGSKDGSTLSFNLNIKSITDSQFTVYGTSSDKNVIKTHVKITGIQSGAVREFEVQIDKTK